MSLQNTSEPKRPRLTWADSKPVDRFPNFVVRKDTTEVEAFPHPLSRSTDLSPSGHLVMREFGSASLEEILRRHSS